MLKWLGFCVLCALGVGAAACGGGGDNSAPPPPPPPNPLYVRANAGNDTNTGGSPDDALRTILKAAQIARSNYRIIVGPGTYPDGVVTASTGRVPQGLMFVADPTGAQTQDTPGEVLIDVVNGAAGFSLNGSVGSLIDGFTIRGGPDAGIVIKSGSSSFTIQNCIIHDNPGDGIRVQDSTNSILFNNLIYRNGGEGIAVAGTLSGSPNALVLNNTIFGNGSRGLRVGSTQAKSSGAFIRNNIIQSNGSDASIKIFTPPPPEVPRSDDGYMGGFNLVLPDLYLPAEIRRAQDIHVDANFVNSNGGDFHLRVGSPAINAGFSLTGTMQQFQNAMRALTTTGGTNCDTGPVDIGFHYRPTGRCTSVSQ